LTQSRGPKAFTTHDPSCGGDPVCEGRRMGTAPTALCGVAGESLRLFHHLHRPMEWTPGVRPKHIRDSPGECPNLCQNTVDGWWDNRNANPSGEPTRRSARTPKLGLN
jgi:hypothetical protein